MCNLRQYRLPFLLWSGGRLSKAIEWRRKQLARHGTARAVPGQLVFPPQDYRGFKQMLNARCSPEETSSGGVFILKPMDPNLLGFFHAQSPGLAPSTPQLNHSL